MQETDSAHGVASYRASGLHARLVYQLVRAGALAGAGVFLVMVVMLVFTIVGRKLFGWQVPGDVELVQMGAAFASAPFLAWCHLEGGDVKVDFITQSLSARGINFLEALGSLMVAVFGGLLAWRTVGLAITTARAGETSALLGWPMWIPQALMVPGLALLALAGLSTFYYFFTQVRRNTPGLLETTR